MGYKDGLQPETLADGNWLVKQNQPVSKIETTSDTNLRSLYESWKGNTADKPLILPAARKCFQYMSRPAQSYCQGFLQTGISQWTLV
jgi:hypothetical protein